VIVSGRRDLESRSRLNSLRLSRLEYLSSLETLSHLKSLPVARLESMSCLEYLSCPKNLSCPENLSHLEFLPVACLESLYVSWAGHAGVDLEIEIAILEDGLGPGI
jgi:hypothetical protein